MNQKKEIPYIPEPINLDGIELPKVLCDLTERIAENVHEVWAQSRMAQGWTYGEIRDDIKKTHPCLVPYNQLPEIEKDYDRHTAVETLKLVMKLGYDIVPRKEK